MVVDIHAESKISAATTSNRIAEHKINQAPGRPRVARTVQLSPTSAAAEATATHAAIKTLADVIDNSHSPHSEAEVGTLPYSELHSRGRSRSRSRSPGSGRQRISARGTKKGRLLKKTFPEDEPWEWWQGWGARVHRAAASARHESNENKKSDNAPGMDTRASQRANTHKTRQALNKRLKVMLAEVWNNKYGLDDNKEMGNATHDEAIATTDHQSDQMNVLVVGPVETNTSNTPPKLKVYHERLVEGLQVPRACRSQLVDFCFDFCAADLV